MEPTRPAAAWLIQWYPRAGRAAHLKAVSQTVVTGLAWAMMTRLDGVIASGLAETGLVHAAYPRVVTFGVREWHVVGAE